MKEPDGQCYDCGRKYGGLGWCDVVVSDNAWKLINPTNPYREGGGLLCFNCMAARFEALGFYNVPFNIKSGVMSANFLRDLNDPKEEFNVKNLILKMCDKCRESTDAESEFAPRKNSISYTVSKATLDISKGTPVASYQGNVVVRIFEDLRILVISIPSMSKKYEECIIFDYDKPDYYMLVKDYLKGNKTLPHLTTHLPRLTLSNGKNSKFTFDIYLSSGEHCDNLDYEYISNITLNDDLPTLT